MTLSIKSIGGTINEQPKVTNLKVINFETEMIEVEYKVEDVELTICRHYITVSTETSFVKNRIEITKNVGYESSTGVFRYKITGLQKGSTYTIQIFASDGLDEGASNALQQSTKNTSLVGFSVNDGIANTDDPSRVTYLEQAVGVAPMTVSSMGGWERRFPFSDLKLVGIKNGIETGEINKNNRRYYLTGELVPSDVDVFLKIPTIYWKISKTGKVTTVKLANYNATGDMVTVAHNNASGVAENNYIAVYQACEEGGRIRSRSGAAITNFTVSLTSGTNSNASNNIPPLRKKANASYNSTLFTGSSFILLQLLFVLAFKSTNTYKFLGTSPTVSYTGTADTRGFISKGESGTASNFLGVENPFVKNQYLDGLSMVWHSGNAETGWAYNIRENNTPSLSDFYNGYKTKVGYTYLQGDTGYVKECVGNNYCGLLPYSTGYPATSTTYYQSASKINQGYVGTGFRGYLLYYTDGETFFGFILHHNNNATTVRLNYRK